MPETPFLEKGKKSSQNYMSYKNTCDCPAFTLAFELFFTHEKFCVCVEDMEDMACQLFDLQEN